MKVLASLIATTLFLNLAANTTAQSNTTSQPKECMGCMPLVPTHRDVMVEVYGDFLYLQPNGSSIYYAAEALPFDNSITIPALSPNWNIYEINTNYTPAFKIGTALVFTEPNTKLEVNWERMFSTKSENHTVPASNDMIGPLFDIGPNSVSYTIAYGRADFHFDEVDLIFSQQGCFFKRLYSNFFAGATFARIKQSLNSRFTDVSGASARSVTTYSKFTGGGPKFGIDFDYRIGGDFFFTGSSAIGLIFGQMQNKTTYRSWASALVTNSIAEPNTQETCVPKRTQLVPSFEEKLGFSYSKAFECWRIKFGVGFLTQIFIDAVQTIDMTAPQVLPSLAPAAVVQSGVYAVGFERTLSNFMLTGPYASLKIDF